MTRRDCVDAFVDDDPRAAALLRQSLATLRDRLARVRRDLTAALEGRLLRAIAESGMREVTAAWSALSPEERVRQVAAGLGKH